MINQIAAIESLRLRRLSVRIGTKIEVNFLGNPILWREPSACAVILRLRLLPGPVRVCSDSVMIAAEVVERPILVAKDFERAGRFSNVILVGLDPYAWFVGLHLHKIGNRPARTFFGLSSG